MSRWRGIHLASSIVAMDEADSASATAPEGDEVTWKGGESCPL
jgi:hypothetical protein